SIPSGLHDTVEQGLRRDLTIGYQHRVEAVVCAILLCPCCNERGVRLTVGVDQEYTRIRRTRMSQHPGDTERCIGGGGRFTDTPFVVGKNKNMSHCHFLFHSTNRLEIAVLARTSRRCAKLSDGSLAGMSSEPSRWLGRGPVSPDHRKAKSIGN